MDVVTAFLNAYVVSEIYMNQPQGFKKKSKDGGELVCKLKKDPLRNSRSPPSMEVPTLRVASNHWF